MWNAIEHTDNDYNKYLDATDGTYKAVMKDCYVQPYSDNPLGQDRIGEDVYLNILKMPRTMCISQLRILLSLMRWKES